MTDSTADGVSGAPGEVLRDAVWQNHRRYRQHGNPFSVRGTLAPLAWQQVYGRQAPLALEIGFGAGGFLLELARRHPEWNVLGLEIRRHFVESVNDGAAAGGLRNVHAVLANANSHLDALIPPASVAFVSLNFPDPWYKRRHQKRRVMRPDWLSVLVPKLSDGAEIHVMTDFEPLAHEMLEVLDSHVNLRNVQGAGCFADASTTGIESERERTHMGRGEPIFRLFYKLLNQCK